MKQTPNIARRWWSCPEDSTVAVSNHCEAMVWESPANPRFLPVVRIGADQIVFLEPADTRAEAARRATNTLWQAEDFRELPF